MSSSTIPFGPPSHPPLQRRREGWNEEGRKTASEATKSRRGDWKRVRCLALFPEDRETEICQVVRRTTVVSPNKIHGNRYQFQLLYQRQLPRVLICEIPLPLPPSIHLKTWWVEWKSSFPLLPSSYSHPDPRPTDEPPSSSFSSPFALYQTSRAKRRREGGEQTPPPPPPLPLPTTTAATIREVEGGGSLGRNGKRDREGYFTFLYLPFWGQKQQVKMRFQN